MFKPNITASRPDAYLAVRRSTLASFLLPLIRPGEAEAAALGADVLTLTHLFGSTEIPFQEIETVEAVRGWFWGRVRIQCASGKATLSGLSRREAHALFEALESARIDWWHRILGAHIEALTSVHARVSQLADPPRYMSRSVFSDLERDAKDAVGQLPSRWPDNLSGSDEIEMLKEIQSFLKDSEGYRARANNTFVANELIRSREFFDGIESRPLTVEQRKAVAVDEDRNLVVAAAGSGKTSVIVAKAGWLLQKGYRGPSELLLLAFARDARKEMEQRVLKRLGGELVSGVTVRTFHSLGMSIIGDAEGRLPTLAKVAEDDKAMLDLLKRIVADLLADRKISRVLLNWFQSQFAPYKSRHEFKTEGDYWDYIQRYGIRSLKGEKLRSYEECEIANFLYLNGVPYEYERPYEYDTATPKKRQYQPDFYLPEAQLYIEHFAINAAGDTPPFINRKEYLQSMAWKRQLHAKHGTILIETFSHEHANGSLTENLGKKLRAFDVKLSPIARSKIFEVLESQGRIDPFTSLLATFLKHFKGARLTFREVARRAGILLDRLRAEAFLAVFEPVFERYEETLGRLGQIDFDDMIARAIDHIEAGRFRSPFGYILVDEFQDISPGRARLLKALLDQMTFAQLFAVGDDWQAIYRFAGSDIAIMREFEERFGNSAHVDLETTFRCSEHIAAVATEFVLKNRAQIPKRVRSTRQVSGPSVYVGLPEKGTSLLREALNRIAVDAGRQDGISTVLLLGRYKHTQPDGMSGLARRHPRLRLSYRTVHRSKGLEADYVVVLGLFSGKYGFPTEVTDDPLLDLVLASPERHPNAEERRLFYVAITRAKRRVFLLADGGPPSPFVQELIQDGYDVTVFGRLPENETPCPRCVRGRLERRQSTWNGNTFYGCSNWPYCDYTQYSCPACSTGLLVRNGSAFRCRDCGRDIESCPQCNGWLRPRLSEHGPFLGCSNWPDCHYTRNQEH